MVFVSLDKTKVKAGTAIRGVATIDNRTNIVISLPHAGCHGDYWLSVGLENQKVIYQPNLATFLCLNAFAVPIGTSNYPVTVSTTYLACGSPSQPSCITVGGEPAEPPLPAGTYHTVVLLPAPIMVGNTVQVLLTR